MSGLQIRNIRSGYDKVDVLHDVSIDVEPGKITCILGANGAGKTTLIRAILGLTPPRAGQVIWDGVDITKEKTHRIVARGIACIPEGRKVFPRMSVEENLILGAYLEKGGAQLRERIDYVYSVFPRLKERSGQLAGTMSGGEQAMVSIGRGLMAAPRLLVIDEPSLGLSPLFVKENFKVIQQINERGITVLLVEQNARQTLAIAHRGYVLTQGRVVAQGSAQELADNDEVRAAYFSKSTGAST
ncbi:MAG TPA: ABC transporter ATP-binding protein [Trinickia sp.]|jgi:branched-chain amino acid transport system ATP-binding protein|uniref:ABC transporter ATP-binding protein n=1 Tax=Trinickia sp. TaxID=2571163 RepID=UPI002B7A0BE5|nr:ABC transporter ATP-binding protein [Trinickia sp.]HTI16989.1 ABC transporter ATP-binding protein [Trinickia sp.]